MNALRARWGVMVDLVIGDDPKVAVAVVLALAVAAAVVMSGAAPTGLVTVGGAVLVGAAFTASLHLDTRHLNRRRSDE